MLKCNPCRGHPISHSIGLLSTGVQYDQVPLAEGGREGGKGLQALTTDTHESIKHCPALTWHK